MSSAYELEERERERIARTAQHLRRTHAMTGAPPISQTEAEAEVRQARAKGRAKRGES